MKILIVTLLFISAAQAIRNLVGLPEKRNTRLHQLLKDGPIDATKLTDPSSSKTTAHLASLLRKSSLNDHGESGSGEGGSGPDEGGPDPLRILAEAVRHIGPALKSLKEFRDEHSEGNARKFLEAVRDNRSDDELKSLLGRHVVEQHGACQYIKKLFAHYVHESVLSDLLQDEDSMSFEHDLAQAFENAHMSDEFDIFEAFTHLAYQHRLHDHPGIKAIMTIGGMITDVACDDKLDGLFGKIGELVERYEPHGEFNLTGRFNLAVYREDSKVCRNGSSLIRRRRGLQSSIRDRLLDLFADPDCKQINALRCIIDAVMEGIALSHKVGSIHNFVKGEEHAFILRVKGLMQQGQEDEAYKEVGDYVLANLRGALTIGLVVKKRLESKYPETPEPTTTKEPKPTTTKAPKSTTTKAPKSTTTKAPKSTTTKAPKSTTTKAPKSTTTKAPKSTNTKAPKSTTTKAPKSTTTKAPKSTTTKAPEPTTNEASEPTTNEASEPTTNEASEPTTNEASEPTTNEASEPTTNEASEPTTNEASEPTTNEASEPTTNEASEPTTNEASEPTTNEASEPTTNEASEPTTNEASEPTTNEASEPTTNEASEPTTNEASEPTTNEASEPTTNEASEPTTNEASEPTNNEASEPTTNEASEPTTNEASEPTTNEAPESTTAGPESTTAGPADAD